MDGFLIYLAFAGGGLLIAFIAVLAGKRYMSALVDKRIAAYQNDLTAKHCEEVQNIYNQMRGWRHDYHNHIQTMKAFISLGKEREHTEYLNKLDDDLVSVDTVLKTGNIMVDAILNSKVSLAVSKKIHVNVKAFVPENLRVSEIDLCVIIGNLLDNAIEACQKLADENERFIRVYIDSHREMLYVSVSNASGGAVRKSGRAYLSTKASPSHGFGLMRVDRIAAKYGGFVNRQNEEGVFATEIMLPL